MFESGIVEQILLGVSGLTVVGVTEILKRWLKARGVGAILVSVAVSAAATAYYLVKAGGFAVLPFVGYTVFVALAANGIYRAASAAPRNY